jgi:hypothetical protein
MGKFTRERELKEKRALKQERKDEKKAEAKRIAEGGEPLVPAEPDEGEETEPEQ